MTRRRLARALGAGGLAAALVTGPGLPATAAPADTGTGADAGTDHSVTLVTGDTVQVTEFDGGRRTVNVTPGEGRSDVVFYQQDEGGDLRVIPSDAAGLMATGRIAPACSTSPT